MFNIFYELWRILDIIQLFQTMKLMHVVLKLVNIGVVNRMQSCRKIAYQNSLRILVFLDSKPIFGTDAEDDLFIIRSSII